MRVLYFHQHFSTPSGATGNRSYHFARKLVARGHSVLMVCGTYRHGNTGLNSEYVRGVRKGVVDGIEIVEFDLPYDSSDSFPKRTRKFLIFAFRCSWLAMSEKYDLVFATSTPLTTAIPGIIARWMRGVPFIFEVRDLWPELPRAMGVIRNPVVLALMSALEWLSYKSATRLIGLSPGIVRGIQKRRILHEKVLLIPNGCDLHCFSDDGQRWRPEGVEDSDLLAIFAGAHGLANGLESVIDAATELRARKRTGIKIVLVGDGMVKQQLIDVAKERNLSNVVFLPPISKPKLAELFRAADLGLQILANIPAFYYGTSPNKFFDYLSAGLPVLTNYPGWIADMIRDEGIGIIAKPDNPGSFADALEEASLDRLSLAEMGVRARRLALREFDRDMLADKFADWLEGAGRSRNGRLTNSRRKWTR